MTDWAATPLKQRLAVLRRARHALAARVDEFADLVRGPAADGSGRRPADTIAAEVLPLCAAIQFLQRRAARILRPQKLGLSGRPSWLLGVRSRITRQPLGRVLILGTWNYPLFLTGVQTVQALAAGNAVQIKPGRDCTPLTSRLVEVLREAGVPPEAVTVLDESTEAAQSAMAAGVDHVVLTGSSTTARAVLRTAADTLTPCTIEASGCDALFVLPGANLRRVADAVAFGMRFNGSATCIGPRRILAVSNKTGPDQFDLLARTLEARLAPLRITPQPDAWQQAVLVANDSGGRVPELCGRVHLDRSRPVNPGNLAATEQVSPLLVIGPDRDSTLLQSDLFAPVVSLVACENEADLLAADAACPYALGASVFGPQPAADRFAARVCAGCVTVNDLIVPTADPRVPFGGFGQSGFGVTRGADGLLRMTRPHVVLTRRGRWLPHLNEPHDQDRALLAGLTEFQHRDRLADRFAGLKRLIKAARR